MSDDRRFSKGERALIALGILVPTAALAWVGVNRKLNTVPEFVPPPQSVPSPNALDTLRAAHALRVSYQPKTAARFDDALTLPLAERQKSLAANAKAIAGIREALGQEYGFFIEWNNPSAQTFPQLTEHREQARLLYFASKAHADSGNLNEAARCALDTIDLGVLIGRGPLIGHLVGFACEGMGRKALWEIIDRLDVSSAEAALDRLETIEKRRVALKEVLKIERAFSQKLISDLASGRLRSMDFVSDVVGKSNPWGPLRLTFTDKGAAWEASGRYFDAMETLWSQPYSPAKTTSPEPPKDPINEFLLPSLHPTRFSDVRNRTDSALLRGTLALKLGNPVPADPFGQNQPLRQKDGKLYSVGPDGDDDSGRSIPTTKKETRSFEESADGDVVARVNTW